MLKLAWRNLSHDRTRFLSSTGGVALSLVLILLISGIFAGSEEHAVLYILKQPAQLWLMQEGVANMHMSSSLLPDNTLHRVQQIDDVEEAVGVLYTNAGLEIGDTIIFNYVFGVDPEAPFGGPWSLVEGTDHLAYNEIIIDKVLADRYSLGVGDSVRLAGFDLTIAGLSEDTFGIGTSIVWVNKAAMSTFMGVEPDANSYILIETKPGQNKDILARDIEKVAPNTNLLSQEAFAESDKAMIRQMGADLIGLMKVIAYAIGLTVIGITTYTATLEKTREYGVLKAIGAQNRQLLTIVFVQAFMASLAGYVIGVVVAYGLGLLVNSLFPEMLVLIQPQHWLEILPILTGVTAIAALLPVSRIMRLDPLIVFKS